MIKTKLVQKISIFVNVKILTVYFYYLNKKHLLHLSDVDARLDNISIDIDDNKIIFDNYLGGSVKRKGISLENEDLIVKRFNKEGKTLDEIVIWMIKKCLEGKEIHCLKDGILYLNDLSNELSLCNDLKYAEKGVSIGLIGKSFSTMNLIKPIEKEKIQIDICSTQPEFEF